MGTKRTHPLRPLSNSRCPTTFAQSVDFDQRAQGCVGQPGDHRNSQELVEILLPGNLASNMDPITNILERSNAVYVPHRVPGNANVAILA
eukprot:8215957-Lingulodinium_polyedra.AAC.1